MLAAQVISHVVGLFHFAKTYIYDALCYKFSALAGEFCGSGGGGRVTMQQTCDFMAGNPVMHAAESCDGIA